MMDTTKAPNRTAPAPHSPGLVPRRGGSPCNTKKKGEQYLVHMSKAKGEEVLHLEHAGAACHKQITASAAAEGGGHSK